MYRPSAVSQSIRPVPPSPVSRGLKGPSGSARNCDPASGRTLSLSMSVDCRRRDGRNLLILHVGPHDIPWEQVEEGGEMDEVKKEFEMAAGPRKT